MSDALRVFIGWDGRQQLAWNVCAESIARHASIRIKPEPISRTSIGLSYERPFVFDGPQQYDIDGRGSRWPVSTDFAVARFWIPLICQYKGLALFVDGDFLFMADVGELLAGAEEKYAVMCTQPHTDHGNEPPTKMDGRLQVAYAQKRWSALMLWNCAHPTNRILNTQYLNHASFLELHQFHWLRDQEIGRLDDRWQWIEEKPKAVHFTRGLPDVAGRETQPYADEWRKYADRR